MCVCVCVCVCVCGWVGAGVREYVRACMRCACVRARAPVCLASCLHLACTCPLERARRGSESIIAQPSTYLSIKLTAFISAGVGGACPLILEAQLMKGSKCCMNKRPRRSVFPPRSPHRTVKATPSILSAHHGSRYHGTGRTGGDVRQKPRARAGPRP